MSHMCNRFKTKRNRLPRYQWSFGLAVANHDFFCYNSGQLFPFSPFLTTSATKKVNYKNGVRGENEMVKMEKCGRIGNGATRVNVWT